MCTVKNFVSDYGTKGIELYFDGKPAADILARVKAGGFRWHKVKKCWYNKASSEARAIADELSDEATTATTAATTASATPSTASPSSTAEQKAEQNRLKNLYAENMRANGEDEKTIDYYLKTSGYFFEYGGKVYSIDKPNIKTSFCFGYGFNGVCTDEDDENRASDLAERAGKSQSFFISENLKPLNEKIKKLSEIKEQTGWNWAENNYPGYMVATYTAHNGRAAWQITDTYYADKTKINLIWDIDFIDKLINGYEIVKADFTKRLNTYLKRYGLKSVHSWSYLCD